MTVDILAFKVVAAPVLIGAATLAGRRWGPGVSGWLVGLPLTSGPVALFLALEQGGPFAAAAAVGSVGGVVTQAAFSVAYARGAARLGWPGALAAGALAFAVVTAALQGLAVSLVGLAAAAAGVLAAALRLLPRGPAAPAPAPAPRWDIPARMAITTALVLVLTAAAPALGPRLTGLLAAFPVYASILTVFAHRSSVASALQVLRGLLLGLFAFAGFFLVLGATIERLGLLAAFLAAAAAALAIQAASLAFVRRPRPVRAPGASRRVS